MLAATSRQVARVARAWTQSQQSCAAARSLPGSIRPSCSIRRQRAVPERAAGPNDRLMFAVKNDIRCLLRKLFVLKYAGMQTPLQCRVPLQWTSARREAQDRRRDYSLRRRHDRQLLRRKSDRRIRSRGNQFSVRPTASQRMEGVSSLGRQRKKRGGGVAAERSN